jgi:hypothetical protein
LAGVLSANADVELAVFTQDAAKARAWSEILQRDHLAVNVPDRDGECVARTAHSFAVTSNPVQAARRCDIVWVIVCYGPAIKDKTSLVTAIRTNVGYQGIEYPMVQISSGKFIPDFEHRFLTEDVPCGASSGLSGRDVASTRCPQRYGFTTLPEVLGC